MKTWAAIVTVAALFVAGISTGALATYLWLDRRAPAVPRAPREWIEPGPPLAGPPSRAFYRHLERELELTADQKREIAEILRASRRRSHEIRLEMTPRLRALMDASRERVLAVLTDSQRDRLERIRAESPGVVERFLLGEGPAERWQRRPVAPPPPPPRAPSPRPDSP